MYLSMLNEEQKGMFLELAYQLALIDNDFSEKERAMIESYCNEMQIAVPEVIRAKPIDEVIGTMKSECTMQEKKIMIFEMLGLVLVDGHYDDAEKKAVEEIMRIFGIEESFAKESERVLEEYVKLQDRMNSLVLK